YFFKKWPQIYRVPAIQRALIEVPVIGPILRKSAATVGFRTLAMLLQANVRVTTALEITAAGSTHINYSEFYLKVRDHIVEGVSLPEAFMKEASRLGNDGRIIAAQMQIAGETGSSTELLDQIASDYEDDLDTVASQIDKI